MQKKLVCIHLEESEVEWDKEVPSINFLGFRGEALIIQKNQSVREFNNETNSFQQVSLQAGTLIGCNSSYIALHQKKNVVMISDWQGKELFKFLREGACKGFNPFKCEFYDGFLIFGESQGPVRIFNIDAGKLLFEKWPQSNRQFADAFFNSKEMQLYLYESSEFESEERRKGQGSSLQVIDVPSGKCLNISYLSAEPGVHTFLDGGRKIVTGLRQILDVYGGKLLSKY